MKDSLKNAASGSLTPYNLPAKVSDKPFRLINLVNALLQALGLGTIDFKEGPVFRWLRKYWFACCLTSLSLFVIFKKGNILIYGNQHLDKDSEQTSNSAAQAERSESGFTGMGNGDAGSGEKRVGLSDLAEADIQDYLQRFKDVALKEQKKFKIPASVILASGMIQSCAGLSTLAKSGNNHFLIKCQNNPLTIGVTGEKNIGGNCYATFENAWTSFRANSTLLSQGKFSFILKKAGKDYQKWASLLQKNGYTTIPNFGKLLVETIEKYDLTRFDN